MQPQNSPPALAPRRARHFTIGLEQSGQAGGDEGLGAAAVFIGAGEIAPLDRLGAAAAEVPFVGQ